MNYLIDFSQDCSESDITNYLTENNCSLIKIFNNFDKVYLISCENTPPTSPLVTSIINDNDTDITPLDLNQSVSITSNEILTVNIHEVQNWWKSVSYVNVDFTVETCNIEKYGKKITVYLLDSGVDLTHPEFVDSDISQIYTFNGNDTDVNGHGTALASLMTGKNTALANAKVRSLKIFEQGQSTKLSKLLEAFDLVITDSASQAFSLVNLSWSIPFNEYVNSKIQYILNSNIPVICSAGNNGAAIVDVTPASLEGVFVVGSYNQNLEACDFSNYTSDLANTQSQVNYGKIDVWAPGESIYVARPNNQYGYVAGTSFSAAIHTAAMAFDTDIQFSIDDYNVIPCKSALMTVGTDGFSAGRENILDLSSNYSASVNLTTVYYSITIYNRRSFLGHRFKTIEGSTTCFTLFQPAVLKSLRIVAGELPPGLTLTKHGWVTGTAEVLLENQIKKPYTLTVEYTFNDNSIETRDIEIYIIKQSITANDLSDDELWILEQGLNCFESPTVCLQRCPFSNNTQIRYCQDLGGKTGCEYCCQVANC